MLKRSLFLVVFLFATMEARFPAAGAVQYRFSFPEPENRLWGYDISPVRDAADKVKAAYERAQPTAESALMSFDERDLVAWTDEAGFDEIHLRYEADVVPHLPELFPKRAWEAFARSSGNPLEPTVQEAIDAALSPSEARELEEHLRPLVERGEGGWRLAVAYLWAS